MTQLPLAGVRVVDLTRILSGPFCAMILGDLGADVIKIEAPGGDHVRGQGEKVDGFSWYFASFNRNKRSVVLDLRNPEGLRVLERLLADADILTDGLHDHQWPPRHRPLAHRPTAHRPDRGALRGPWCRRGAGGPRPGRPRPTGRGLHDDVDDVDAGLSLGQCAGDAAAMPPPTGNDHPIASPYGLFRAQDGDIAIAPSTLLKIWRPRQDSNL
jgi:CoA:oxalate CoA-transferase